MATSQDTIDFLLDQLGGGAFRTRRMFGEYALYHGDRVIALVCDDTLFVKDTPSGRAAIERSTAVELGAPYPGAKLHLRVTPDAWDDGDWLRRIADATAEALPAPRPKAAKGKAKKTTRRP